MIESSSSDNCKYHHNPELQLINTKLIIKAKLKELLGDLKKFKVSQY